MLSINDYELRVPNNNAEYFNKLSTMQKEEYIKLYELYSYFLQEYLIKNANLLAYDNLFKNNQNNFVAIPKEKIDMYQALYYDKLKYIYLRNNIYIERLSSEELNYLASLKGKEYNPEIEAFIAKTYKKIIIEKETPSLKLYYGFKNRSYEAHSNALVLGVRFDRYANYENNSKWEEEIEKRLRESDFIKEKIKEELISKLNMNVEIIEYGDFSVNILNYESNIKRR